MNVHDAGFPHGTVAGYRAGCTGSQCGAPVACRDVYTRYQGDWGFKRKVDAGVPVAEIFAAEEAEREAQRAREKELRRQEHLAALKERKKAKGAGQPGAAMIATHTPEITRLHAEGKNDVEISEAIGMSRAWVGKVRRQLGLVRVPRLAVARDRYHDDIRRLHAEGLNDRQIGEQLGISTEYTSKIRRDLNLPAHNVSAMTAGYAERVAEHADTITRMHGEGKFDREIADEIGMTVSWVNRARHTLGLPGLDRNRGRFRRSRTSLLPEVIRLHAQGLRDAEVGVELDITAAWAGTLRRQAGLPAHVQRAEPKAKKPRHSIQADVEKLNAEGLTDAEIANRLNTSTDWIGVVRRRAGLAAQHRENLPHGTNACWARGCRRDECVEAHKEYMRAYRASRKQEPVPDDVHGTAYGYQLGCRGRKSCPANPSCTDAMLEQDRARRRAAGVPEQSERVPADPVRAHVRELVDAGKSVLAIAEEANVSRSGIKTLLYGRSGARKGEFPAHIEREKAERLLALRKDAA